MNPLIPIAIVLLVIVFFMFKFNNLRTKVAFFFIIAGLFFILFFTFFLMNSETYDFASIGKFFLSIKVYFVWMKDKFVDLATFTGKLIGVDLIK